MSRKSRKQRKQKNRELKNKEKRQYEVLRKLRSRLNNGVAIVTVEMWDEDRTPFRPLLCLDAATYRPQPLFDIPPCNPDGKGPHRISPAGNFAYCNRILAANTPLKSREGNRPGLVWWTGEVVIPMLKDMHVEHTTGDKMPESLAQKTRAERGAVWMSLTPMEMISQRRGIQAASGTVVIGGLGMGWFLRKVCEKPEVEKVIVVEHSQDLLDWYGHDLCSKQDKVADVICGDVYDQIGRHGNAKYLLDIWLNYFDVHEDPRFKKAKRELGNRLWGWGES